MVAPKISVVVPAYNVENYVEQCIDSLLNQTFQDIELIIIDDCSTDKTLEIINNKYGKLDNVSIFKNDVNIGQGQTRNKAMKIARGKYIYFLDSDDVLLSNGLETLYVLAEKNNADIMHINEWYEPEDEFFDLRKKVPVKIKRDAGFRPEPHRLPMDANVRVREIYGKQRHSVMVWLNLYRRDFLLENKLKFPAMIHEDNVFAMACYVVTDKFYSSPGAFYLYRQRKNSTIGEFSYAKLEREINAMVVGLRYLDKMLSAYVDSETVRIGKISFFYELFHNIIPYYTDGKKIPVKTLETVEVTLKDYFGRDYFLVSMLMHHAASAYCRLNKANVQRT